MNDRNAWKSREVRIVTNLCYNRFDPVIVTCREDGVSSAIARSPYADSRRIDVGFRCEQCEAAIPW